MSSNGWISLHRKMLDNPIVFKDSDHVAVWVYLLLNATHTELPSLFQGKKITLQPGQLITGRKSISLKLNIAESKVQRILKTFESEQQIEQQTSNKNRLISIVSWSEYQDNEQQNEHQVNNKRTTTEQQVNTNNNVNNVNNDNKKDNISPKNPKRIYSEDELYYRLAKRFHELAFKNAKDAGTAHLIKEPNYQSWADTFRLMFERDKVKENEIGNVVKFALSDSFYRTIIFSPTNLRKHYLAILTKMNTGGGGHRGNKGVNAGSTSADRKDANRKEEQFRGKPVEEVPRELVESINNFE